MLVRPDAFLPPRSCRRFEVPTTACRKFEQELQIEKRH